MIAVLRNLWPLFLGLALLMVGNGIQGTLLGVRGAIEGFATWQLSIIMSAYYAGFLIGSRMAPGMIRRVGHVRVFAALGSLISAALVLFAAVPDWMAWVALRMLIGFAFCGVYVTAESWLNNAATNETRGQTLSLYMIVQMVGIISAQGLLNIASPEGYALFALASVLVSVAFTPILLSIGPTPVFATIKPMTIRALFVASPLGCVGMFLVGGISSAMYGMAAVWGTLAGLSVAQISAFIAAIFVGGLLLQYPLGWVSDRMDRRRLAVLVALAGAAAMAVAVALPLGFPALLGLAVIIGGVGNPLYSLLLAHTNDFLDNEDMAAASAGLLFISGLGAVVGPLLTGVAMAQFGPNGFFAYIGLLCTILTAYALWRTTRRPAPAVETTAPFSVTTATASPIALEAVYVAAQEDAAQAEAEAAAQAEAEAAAEAATPDSPPPDADAPPPPDRPT